MDFVNLDPRQNAKKASKMQLWERTDSTSKIAFEWRNHDNARESDG